MSLMAKRLSYQQIQILKTVNRKSCSANEFGKLYTGCNIYRALNILTIRGLISHSGNKYYLTERGKIVLALFT